MQIIPQAAVISKDTDKLAKGKYGPIFPKTPRATASRSSRT